MTRGDLPKMMAREIKARESMLPPTLPAELLREDVLPATELSVSAAARAHGVTRRKLRAVLEQRKSLTPEMVLRLGKLFVNGPELWLNMQ